MPEVKDGISSMLKTRKEQLLRAAYLSALRNDAVVVNVLAKQIVDAGGKVPAAAARTAAPAAPRSEAVSYDEDRQRFVGGREDTFLLAPLQHLHHGRFVEGDRVVVHIQLNVPLGHAGIHLLRVRRHVVPAGLRMREGVFDTGAKRAIDLRRERRRQVAPNRNRRERQRAVHALLPHLAQIGEQRQSLGLVGKPALVNQHAAIGIAAKHRVFDLIESHHDGIEAAELSQQQRRRRPLSRNRNPPADVTLRLRDDDGADAEAGRSTGAQQDVAVAKAVAVGVDRHLRHLCVGSGGADVQRFDVVEVRRDADAGNESVHDRVKRERVVWAGREGEVTGSRACGLRGLGLAGLGLTVSSHAITALCAAIAASFRRQDFVSRFVTMLLIPRTSPTRIRADARHGPPRRLPCSRRRPACALRVRAPTTPCRCTSRRSQTLRACSWETPASAFH